MKTGPLKVGSLLVLLCEVRLLTCLTALMDSMKADHGFNMDSKTVRNLLQVMSEYDASERRKFLQFVTGSPKLPIGGKSNSAIRRILTILIISCE